MPKFKAYVKVPADSKGSLKRIITKTVNALVVKLVDTKDLKDEG